MADDLTQRGLDRLPDARKQPLILAVLQASLERFASNDVAAQQVQRGLDIYGGQTFSFLLDVVGGALGQPRLLNQLDSDYIVALQARVLVRRSRGTRPDIKVVAQFISDTYGNGLVSVQFPAAKHVTIGIGSLDPDPAIRRTVARLLLDAVGEVDRFTLVSVPVNAFIWGVANQGWDMGVWVETVFESY